MERMDVGIGQWSISDNPSHLIKTYALGSCVALTIWDKKAKGRRADSHGLARQQHQPR
jgi:chemotaxis receptor (MCP) glutamine deamidase CheD